MRGKPKGIRRKDAKELATVSEKISLSLYGEIASWPERQIFEDFHLLRWLLDQDSVARSSFCSDAEFEAWKAEANERARGAMIAAVLENDAEFFDRMAAIARFRKGQPRPVDEMGFNVLIAFRSLELKKAKISAPAIADILAERFPRDDGQAYDERDIRRVMRELGIGRR
jgi:hypothetical protein